MGYTGTAAAGKTFNATGNGTSPTFQSIGTNSGLTAHGVVIAEGNGAFVASTAGGAGQVFTSNGAASDPTFQAVSAIGVVTTLTPDSGGAQSPSAGNINDFGTGSITTVGSGSTITTQLTGLTNHSVLVGAGTATITKVGPVASTGAMLQSNGVGSDPGFSTSTWPATTTINQLLYSSSANIVAGLTAANSATLVSTSAGVPVWSASMTSGQMIIGSTGATPVAGTITSTGGTITVSTGAGTLNLEVVGGGFAWVDATNATQALLAAHGYVTDRGAGVTYTLPASGTLGDIIKIVGKLGIAVITPNANQQILIGSTSGTVGVTGTATANNVGDCIELVCITAGAAAVWRADSVIGTWSLA